MGDNIPHPAILLLWLEFFPFPVKEFQIKGERVNLHVNVLDELLQQKLDTIYNFPMELKQVTDTYLKCTLSTAALATLTMCAVIPHITTRGNSELM